MNSATATPSSTEKSRIVKFDHIDSSLTKQIEYKTTKDKGFYFTAFETTSPTTPKLADYSSNITTAKNLPTGDSSINDSYVAF